MKLVINNEFYLILGILEFLFILLFRNDYIVYYEC